MLSRTTNGPVADEGDRVRSVRDEAQVRLVVFVQRCRHTNNPRVHFADSRIFRSGREPIRLGCLNILCWNPEDVGATLRDRVDLFPVDVESCDW